MVPFHCSRVVKCACDCAGNGSPSTLRVRMAKCSCWLQLCPSVRACRPLLAACCQGVCYANLCRVTGASTQLALSKRFERRIRGPCAAGAAVPAAVVEALLASCDGMEDSIQRSCSRVWLQRAFPSPSAGGGGLGAVSARPAVLDGHAPAAVGPIPTLAAGELPPLPPPLLPPLEPQQTAMRSLMRSTA